MTKIQSLLATNLKAAREQLGLSQELLSERCGISRGFLGEVETGRKFPSPKTLEKLADAVGLRPFELFYDGTTLSRSDEQRLLKGYSTLLKGRIEAEIDKLANEHTQSSK